MLALDPSPENTHRISHVPCPQNMTLQINKHGLFLDYTEIQNAFLREYANTYGYVLGSVNLLGLSKQDAIFVTEIVATNGTYFAMVPDRCHQRMLDALFFMKLLLSPKFINDDIFKFNGSSGQFGIIMAIH